MLFFQDDSPDIFRSSRGIRLSRLLRRRNTQWVETSFLEEGDDISKSDGGTRTHTTNSLTRKRERLLLFGFAVLLGLAVCRIGYLQIWHGGVYRDRALGNSQRIIPIPADRGLFFDREGVQLTKNVPKFSLALVPQDLPRDKDARDAVVVRLSELTSQNPDDVRATIKEYGNYSYESIIIKDDIDYETALAIEIDAAELPGVRIEQGSKRLYMHSAEGDPVQAKSLSHVFGYIGKLSPAELDTLYSQGYLPSDDIGKTGIERTYEKDLRGVYGRRRIEVDAAGREQSVLAEVEPVHGSNLILSIDARAQEILERALQRALDALPVKRGSAVAIDPRNGEVIAMVSLPAFNNNDFSGGISSTLYKAYTTDKDLPLFNRVISGTYPSGSTIKPAVAAIALHEGIVNAGTTVNSNGGVQVGSWFFPDWQAGGHGITNVTKAIAWSVNTFFYYVGGGYNDFEGLGVDTLTAGMRLFGLSELSRIDLPNEAEGFVPSPQWKQETKNEPWYIGDTYNISIGQGDILVTPLQIAQLTVAVANGGTLYEPRVVKAVVDPQTGEEREVESTVIRTGITSPEDLAIVRQGMRECVTYGSCRRLSSLPFEAAAKSGTAQWSNTKDTHAWYSSFAPYQNPEIVVVVMVEEGGGGSAVSGPVVYDFYKEWWEYKQNQT